MGRKTNLHLRAGGCHRERLDSMGERTGPGTHTNTSYTSLPCAQGPQGSYLHTVFTLFIKIKNLPATLHRKESWWGSSPPARLDPDFQPRLPRPAAPGAAPFIATRLSTVRGARLWGASCTRLQLLPAVGPQASL